ncbi:MAG: GNAT family N-acetyltransferase [Cyanobacteria bacterium P01_C01_bin.118]
MNHPISIEPADSDDAKAILAIHYAAIRQTAASSYSQEVIEAWSHNPTDEKRIQRIKQHWIENPNHHMVVAKVNDLIVGFGFIHNQGEIQGVYVHPDYGRQGIGGQLLMTLEEVAIAAHLSQLRVDSSLNAELFYKQHGFEVIEYGSHQLNSGLSVSCVKMHKNLPPLQFSQ